MKRLSSLLMVFALLMAFGCSSEPEKKADAPAKPAGKAHYVFGGGPAGGTFQVVANAIQVFPPVKDNPKFTVKAQSSGGSVENLLTTTSGRVAFSTV